MLCIFVYVLFFVIFQGHMKVVLTISRLFQFVRLGKCVSTLPKKKNIGRTGRNVGREN